MPMVELFLICALGKPTAPCPPPPPSPVEIMVGLPAKNVELVDERSESEEGIPYSAENSSPKQVQKLPKTNAKSGDYNRRGNRNH